MVRWLLRFVTIACPASVGVVFIDIMILGAVILGAVTMGFTVGHTDPARVGHF